MKHCLLVSMLLLTLAGAAQAHKPSDSYLRLQCTGSQVAIEWDIALRDLDFVLGLDSDQNGEITWGELRAKQTDVAAYALSRLQVASAGAECDLRFDRLLFTAHSDGGYAVLACSADLTANDDAIDITYQLLFDVDPTHRGLLLVETDENARTHIFTPDEPHASIAPEESNLWRTFLAYTREGVWHIWIGFDHILFLLTLLLPAVMQAKAGQWRPAASFRHVLHSVLKIVTVFTVAHSITLWLAVTQLVTAPAQGVEVIIALSIVFTAINNLRPNNTLTGWQIAFAFGLIHGFGFANVLVDLGLPTTMLATCLLAFNVGVELGQIVIVLAVLPVLYALRSTAFYRIAILKLGSILIAGLASVWSFERLFGVEVLGF